MKYPLIRNNFKREDLDAVINLLSEEDPRLTNGPKVQEFEESLNNYLKPYLENALQTGWLIGKKAIYPGSIEYRIILRDL